MCLTMGVMRESDQSPSFLAAAAHEKRKTTETEEGSGGRLRNGGKLNRIATSCCVNHLCSRIRKDLIEGFIRPCPRPCWGRNPL